ncbi:UNVERIFIED_CONTAM: hypothetical protein B566_EDAN018494, partial [Ephemera danica]
MSQCCDSKWIDMSKWSYEITMAGGGNWEFQTYHDMYG